MNAQSNHPGLITSPSLSEIGVPHAFTTRMGGVSVAPFDSLNFGNPGELPPGVARDPKSNIERNFHIVLDALACASRRIVQVHQVHGAEVLVEPSREPRRATKASTPPSLADARGSVVWGEVKADAIVTDDPSCVVAIRVADCCPVLLTSTDGRIVAAVHAGWRGVIAGVATAAVAQMRRLGAGEMVGAIGPCISAAHFEVGPEVVEEFRRTLGDLAPIHRESRDTGKGYIDLRAALRLQLVRARVDTIDVLAGCTLADESLYFSHRRDRGVTGRMIGIIGPKA